MADFDTGLRTLNTGTVLLQDAVCAPGLFRTSLLDLCKPCPRNFFCPSERQTGLPNVVKCGDNQVTDTIGASSITQCECKAGFKISNYNEPNSYCLECDYGERCQDGTVVETFCHYENKVPNANHDECVCQEGFFMSNFACVPCAPGFVKNFFGNEACQACPPGTYSKNTTMCVACAPLSSAPSRSSACVCQAPYIWRENHCNLCASNHFWHNYECHSCPVLTTSISSPNMRIGFEACVCARGHASVPQNVSGVLKCVACSAGTFEKNGTCVECPVGASSSSLTLSLDANSTELSVCKCLSNSGNDTGSNNTGSNKTGCDLQRVDGSCAGECATTPPACTPCKAGYNKSYISTTGNTDQCIACPQNTFQPALGSLWCESCKVNEFHSLLAQISAEACLCVPGFTRALNVCTACVPGHYKNWLGNDLCAECALGQYNAMAQATACTSCALATENQEVFALALLAEFPESTDNISNSTVLQSNSTTTTGSVSVFQCVCGEGQEPSFMHNNLEHSSLRYCQKCKPGSFQEHPGHAFCSYCGALSFGHGHALLHHYGQAVAGASDSTHCIPCPQFSGQDESLIGPGNLIMNSNDTCMCFRGHERTDAGCTNCSEYMVQPFFSNTKCSFCPQGHYFVSRHVPCQLCDLAEDYNSSTGNRHVGLLLNSIDINLTWGVSEYDCVCAPGFQRSVNNFCEKCPVGKYRADISTRYCNTCPFDTFQDSVGQLTCTQCPAHARTFLTGSTALTQCVCGPGFQPLSVSENTQEGVCLPCNAGTFRTERWLNESGTQCMPCPADHYCETRATTPMPCPTGEVSLHSSQSSSDCKCKPGFGRSFQNWSCTVCALGFYSEISSNLECTKCPSNKTTILDATTNKTLCVCIPAHGIVDDNSSSPCVPCAPGFFSQGLANVQCTSCGWGTMSEYATHFYDCTCNVQQGVFELK